MLVLAYWAMAASVSPRLGVTFDEPGHITSGYAYWKFGDFRINAENGMLGTRVAAVPLLGLDLNFPSRESPAWTQPNARALGGGFFFDTGNDYQLILRRARFAIGLFGVGLALLVWTWSRHLFGATAGWLSLGVAVFSPTLLAHGGLATSDIVVSCCLLAAVSAFWRLWHRVTWPRLALAGVAGAAALLAKTSGLLLLPMLAALFVVRTIRPIFLPVKLGCRVRYLRGRGAVAGTVFGVSAAAGALAFGLVWAGYLFRFEAAPGSQDGRLGFDPAWETLLEGASPEARRSSSEILIENPFTRQAPSPLVSTVLWCRNHRVLPEAYLWSLTFTFRASRSRPSFFWGTASDHGSPWFFPASFLLKTTPAECLLLTLGLAGAMLAARWERRTHDTMHPYTWRRGLYRAAPLLVLFVVYWGIAITTPLNIGHRHLLPVYAVIFVGAGAAALWIRTRRRKLALLAILLASSWQLVDSVSARPFYLSYFTPFVGDHGWRYLVDSSYDWGQGLPALKTWMDARRASGDAQPVFLSYFGSDSPRARNIAATRFADWRDDTSPRSYPASLRGGWYAISATNFQRVYAGVSGPWTAFYEQRYQEILAAFPKDSATAARLTEVERAVWLRNAMLCEILQLGRLCHYLGDRKPAAVIGSSLLLFRLSDDEVRTALHAPLAEIEQLRHRVGPK